MVPAVSPKIESKDLSLDDLFKDFYTVPDFQREYVWQDENVERLLQDVHDELYDEKNQLIEQSEYFIGSIVVCPGNGGTYQLIDGQQRLTTIYLVLCAIRDMLVSAGQKPGDTLSNQISATNLNPLTGEDVHRFRLTLQYEDSDGALEKIASAAVPIDQIAKSTASVENLLRSYDVIREFLATHVGDEAKHLRMFLAAFTLRVKVIRIITPNVSHALKVFETINDRGVSLNAMDLLKNLLFMRTPSKDYPKLKETWKAIIDMLKDCHEKPLRFLRYFIIAHYSQDSSGLREDEIYQWFVANADKVGINAAPLLFVERLLEASRAYAQFTKGHQAQGQPVPYLSNITALSGTARQHFILLLAAAKLPAPVFSELCRQIENLYFCYIITREQTKIFEKNFARWSKDLRAVTNEQELAAFIEKNFLPELVSRAKTFDFAFQELTQSRLQQYKIRYILAKLTQFIDEQAWGTAGHVPLSQYLDKSVHIEHILPKSPSQELRDQFDKPAEYKLHVEKLGNLVLLEKTINTSISNSDFSTKRPNYAQSKFLLTKSIAEKPKVGINTQLNKAVEELIQFNEWDSAAITQRQQMLHGLARRIWQIPVDSLV